MKKENMIKNLKKFRSELLSLNLNSSDFNVEHYTNGFVIHDFVKMVFSVPEAIEQEEVKFTILDTNRLNDEVMYQIIEAGGELVGRKVYFFNTDTPRYETVKAVTVYNRIRKAVKAFVDLVSSVVLEEVNTIDEEVSVNEEVSINENNVTEEVSAKEEAPKDNLNSTLRLNNKTDNKKPTFNDLWEKKFALDVKELERLIYSVGEKHTYYKNKNIMLRDKSLIHTDKFMDLFSDIFEEEHYYNIEFCFDCDDEPCIFEISDNDNRRLISFNTPGGFEYRAIIHNDLKEVTYSKDDLSYYCVDSRVLIDEAEFYKVLHDYLYCWWCATDIDYRYAV